MSWVRQNIHRKDRQMPLHKTERTCNHRQKLRDYKHINTCEQFNYLTNLLQLNIDEPNTDQFNLTAFLLNNCNIIDRAKHWSNLLFKEALAIHRQKPELNHGTKASRELSVFF